MHAPPKIYEDFPRERPRFTGTFLFYDEFPETADKFLCNDPTRIDMLTAGATRKIYRKGRTVKKVILTAAATAIFLCSGLASVNYAKAQDGTDQRGRYQASEAPIGEKGVRWGDQCWIDTSGGGYWGYWAPCTPPARSAKR